jgi:integrase
MSKRAVPKYGHHKPSGQARVRINGKDHWLGKYGSPQSYKKYAALIYKWEQESDVPPTQVTFAQMSLLYSQYAASHYMKNGKQTSEVGLIKKALKWMNQVCRDVSLADIRPRHLKESRRRMVESGLARTTVNKFIQRIRRAVKWSVSEELCEASVLVGLQSVEDLKRGRTKAHDNPRIKPVPEAYINAVEEYVLLPVWGAIRFQLATGARPGEALIIRGCDLDMSGPIWTYTPESHKTEHHGKDRTICIGPKGQAVIREFLDTDLQSYLFGTKRSKRQKPYRRDSYTTAVARGCVAANVPGWSPNRLRHNFATISKKHFGIEMTRASLGHSSAVTSEIYAEQDIDSARAVVAKIG